MTVNPELEQEIRRHARTVLVAVAACADIVVATKDLCVAATQASRRREFLDAADKVAARTEARVKTRFSRGKDSADSVRIEAIAVLLHAGATRESTLLRAALLARTAGQRFSADLVIQARIGVRPGDRSGLLPVAARARGAEALRHAGGHA